MDEGDEYVPQISQMDYMMDGSQGSMVNGQQYNRSMGAMNYYEQPDSSALNAMQQMTNMYAPPQGPPQNCYMNPQQQQQMMYQQQQAAQMRPPVPQQQAPPPQPPAKQKRQRKNKKAEAAAAAAEAAAAQQAQQQQQQRYGGYMPPQMVPPRPQNPYEYSQQQPQQFMGPYPPHMSNPQGAPGFRPPAAPPTNGAPYGHAPPGYPPSTQIPPGQQQAFYQQQQQMRPPYYPQQGGQPGGMPPPQYPPQMPQGQPPRYPPGPGQSQQPPVQPPPPQSTPQSSSGYGGGYLDMNGYYQQQPSSSTGYPKAPSGPQGGQTPQPHPNVNSPYGYPGGPQQQQQQPPRPAGIPGPSAVPGAYGAAPGQPSFVQIQMEMQECDRQMQLLYSQQRTPEVMQKADILQQKMHYLKRMAMQQMPPGQLPPGYPQPPPMASPGVQPPPQAMHHYPPMSQEQLKNPSSMQQQMHTPTSSVPGTPVSVMQTNANQVQVNITPDQPGRTLISVYHQYPQPGSSASTSSAYSKDGVVHETAAAQNGPQTNHVPPPQQFGSYQNNNQIQKQNQMAYPKQEVFDPQVKNVDKMLVGASELVTAEENYPEEHKIERIENVNAVRNQANEQPGMSYNGQQAHVHGYDAPYQQQQQQQQQQQVHPGQGQMGDAMMHQQQHLLPGQAAQNIQCQPDQQQQQQDEFGVQNEQNSTGKMETQEEDRQEQEQGAEESNQSIDDYDIKPRAPAPRQMDEELDDSRASYQKDSSIPPSPQRDFTSFPDNDDDRIKQELESQKASTNEVKMDAEEVPRPDPATVETPVSPRSSPVHQVEQQQQQVQPEVLSEAITAAQSEQPAPLDSIQPVQMMLIDPLSEASSMGTTPISMLNVQSQSQSEATPIPDNEMEEDSVATEDISNVSPDVEEEAIEPRWKPPGKARQRKPAAVRKTPAKAKKRKKESDNDDEEDLDFAISVKSARKHRKMAQQVAAAELMAAGVSESELSARDLIETRRSGRRKVEDKSYADEGLMEFEEPINDPNGSVEEEEEPLKNYNMHEDVWLVEKIIAMRQEKRPVVESPEDSEQGLEALDEKIAAPEDEAVEKVEENGVKEEEEVVDEVKKEEETEQPSTSAAVKEDEEDKVVENGTLEAKEDPKSDVLKGEGPTSVEKEEKEVEMELVDVFFVKFRHKSYRHCAWRTIAELEFYDPKVTPRCNRFRLKNEYLDDDVEDNELFNEDFLIADRVVDIEVDDEGTEYCFIKWHALAYEEASWERGDTISEDLKKYYHLWNDEIDQVKVKQPGRPGPEAFQPVSIDKMYKGENLLREYQVDGVNWLLFCYFERNNCILADEMGLGKTVQTITLLQGVYDAGVHGPFLVVVPLSTLHNWEREFETWTDLNAVVYHGGSKSREIIQKNEFYYKQTMVGKKKPVIKFDALITTFEMVVTDCEVLRKFNFRVCVIDEAHRLKNKNCKLLTSGLGNFKVDHRVLLTGTPLQNNINELFSLLNFLDPTKFDSSNDFLEKFGNCQTEEQVMALQSMLKPMMLRRLKEDVEKTLQPKQETIIEVQLSNIQKKYYRAILERNFTHLLKSTHMPSMMNTMMELRKCCNHPYLIKGAEDQIMTEIRELYPDKNGHDQITTGLIQASGKLVLIDKLLPKLRQDGHKVLVFSQMVKVLDIIEEYLGIKGFLYERIDGNVRGDLRQAAIDRFSKPDSDKFVFLLCTRAGGLGINLTAADTVIIFDSDWNPQNDLQAQARCHRIGQTKMVKVYRLITSNTYEREMFDRASLKLGLDKAVLQSTALSALKEQTTQLSKKEVEDLLKKGAYGAVMDEDNEGSKFSEEDIDTILQRRTQTITIEPGVKGSTFAKASFKSTNNEDIDVDDPNFWQKWASKAQIQVKEKGAELIVEEPRSRRRRFDEFNQNQEGSGEEEGSEDDGKQSRDRSQGELRNRSGKKRRRPDDDDEEYYGNSTDELSFNKTEYFKLEKLILVWGWHRWDVMKDNLDIPKTETEIEHMSRTLILHCIREFRGDERSREYVWRLITPTGVAAERSDKKNTNVYHQGWASNPEYNPPGFALDSSFRRHVYRHTNKLIARVHFLHLLKDEIITDKWSKKSADFEVSYKDIEFVPPTVNDPPLSNWTSEHDKCLLIGVYRHGSENYDAIRDDKKLIFVEKPVEEFPTQLELNNRFKRLMQMHIKQADIAVHQQQQLKAQIQNQIATRGHWTLQEEADFLKTLINFGVWDHTSNDKINIKWARFREFTPTLAKKTDVQMIENLYCVLARCSMAMGNNGPLSEIDETRAVQIKELPKKTSTIVMQRLTLMRKVHINFMTKDDETRRIHIKMMPLDKMPKGWTYTHDEKMFQVADSFGISSFRTKLLFLPEFKQSGFEMPSDQQLFQRLFEIVATVDSGKYSGDQERVVFEMEEEQASEDEIMLLMMAAAMAQAQASAATPAPAPAAEPAPSRRSAAKKKPTIAASTPLSTASKKDNSSKFMQGMDQAALQQSYMALLTAAAAPSNSKQGSSAEAAQQLAQLSALMQMAMAPTTMNSSTLATAKALEDALNLSKKEATPKPSSSSSKQTSAPSTSSNAQNNSTMAMLSATEAAFEQVANQLGISLTELILLQQLDQSTPIFMYNSETNQRVQGDKAPLLSGLESWMRTHPKYKIDINSTFANLANPQKKTSNATATASSSTPSTSKANNGVSNVASTSSTPAPSTSQTPVPGGSLEPGEIPKTPSTSKSSSSEYDTPVAIFLKTGQMPSKDKWPSLKNLQTYLDKNPDAFVQSSHAAIAKAILPKSYHNRIGGEEILALAALMNPYNMMASMGSSSNAFSAPSAASSSSSSNAANQAVLEAAQMQLLMQMYNPYNISMTGMGGGLTAGSGLTGANLSQFGLTPSTSSSTKTSTPKPSTSAMPSSSKMSNAASNAASQALQESALAAELMTNPAFAQLLGMSATPSSSANSLGNYNLSAADTNMLNQLALLQMLSGASNMGSMTGSTTTSAGSGNKTDKKSNGNGSSTPTSSKKSLGKIVEDLAKSTS